MENAETKKEENIDEFFIMMIFIYEIFKNIKNEELDKSERA